MDGLLVIVVILCAFWIIMHMIVTYKTKKLGQTPEGFIKVGNKYILPSTPFLGANEVF